jgi:membrane-associated phospholipid phosphatase
MAIGRFSEKYYDENSGFLLGTANGLNFIITFGIKFTVDRERPYKSLKNVYCREPSLTDPYSFPSGHASISFTMASMFNLRYPKYPQIYVPMYLYALIVSYGRPYFGMHYPSDLAAGALVGAGSSILIFSLRKHLLNFKNNLLSENKDDNGSIGGKMAWIFGGTFVFSSIAGQLILGGNNKINFQLSPIGKNNSGLNLNMNFRF